MHPHQPKGGRATDPEDYPAERGTYALRAPDRLIAPAVRVGSHVGAFATQLLAGPFPWAKLRQGQKRLRLGEHYTATRLEAACARALGFGFLDVRRVERCSHCHHRNRMATSGRLVVSASTRAPLEPRHLLGVVHRPDADGKARLVPGGDGRTLGNDDPWLLVAFMVAPNGRLGDETPAAVHRRGRAEEIEAVVCAAAAVYGEQGAARALAHDRRASSAVTALYWRLRAHADGTNGRRSRPPWGD